MKAAMLGLLAETPIHLGTGRSTGVVDLPVAREAATDYPVAASSGLKGALRDRAEQQGREDVPERFGREDRAGDLLVSDGRLLLLPVRSLTGAYRWVTCPHLLERYDRDLRRAGLDPLPAIPTVRRGSALVTQKSEESLYLEERQFSVDGGLGGEIVAAIAPLLFHRTTRERLNAGTVVLDTDDFAWFARYGLSIQARNVLQDGTKKTVNLWYEETLPPDTVMYALVMGRTEHALGTLQTILPASDPYLQAGGNETVGQGWFAVTIRAAGEGGQA